MSKSEELLRPSFPLQAGPGQVVGVIGESADVPCEATPTSKGDAPYLILWYKDIFGTPIYSYDMRSGLSGSHWMERRALGDRATFHIRKTGDVNAEGVDVLRAYLRIEDVSRGLTSFFLQ